MNFWHRNACVLGNERMVCASDSLRRQSYLTHRLGVRKRTEASRRPRYLSFIAEIVSKRLMRVSFTGVDATRCSIRIVVINAKEIGERC